MAHGASIGGLVTRPRWNPDSHCSRGTCRCPRWLGNSPPERHGICAAASNATLARKTGYCTFQCLCVWYLIRDEQRTNVPLSLRRDDRRRDSEVATCCRDQRVQRESRKNHPDSLVGFDFARTLVADRRDISRVLPLSLFLSHFPLSLIRTRVHPADNSEHTPRIDRSARGRAARLKCRCDSARAESTVISGWKVRW